MLVRLGGARRVVTVLEATAAPLPVAAERRPTWRSSGILVVDGKLRPVIGSTYPLAEAPAALELIETGHARGKVVIAIAS